MSDSSTSPVQVTLIKELSTYSVDGRTQAYRMLITVTEASGIDPNLFMYQVVNDTAEFSNVTSPLDLETYPVGTPEEDVPFYRVAQVDLICANPVTLDDTWNMILADINELIRTITKLATMESEVLTLTGVDTIELPQIMGDLYGSWIIANTDTTTDISVPNCTANTQLSVGVGLSTGGAGDPGTVMQTPIPSENIVRLSVNSAPGLGGSYTGTWTLVNL
jgi:hypothetical protein